VENAYSYGKDPAGIANPAAEFDEVPLLPAPDGSKEGSAGLKIENIGEFEFTTKQKYFIRGLVNYGMIALMTGRSNAGKSPLALDIAAHVAQGNPWQGRKFRKGYVLYVSTEGWTGIKGRMEAIRRTYFQGQERVPFDFVACAIDLRSSPKGAKDIITTVDARSKHFGVPPALVIIDTMSHALGGGDESNPEHVRALVSNCQRITGKTGAGVMLLHHPTKDASSDYRGSSILINDTDLLIKVEIDEKSKVRTVSTPRVKEYGEIDKLFFNIKVVELGKDEENDPVTSVVVDWMSAEFAPLPETGAEADSLAAFEKLRSHLDTQPGQTGCPQLSVRIEAVQTFFGVKGGDYNKVSNSTLKRWMAHWKILGIAENPKRGQWVIENGPKAQERLNKGPEP
jgi:hypothetical protein